MTQASATGVGERQSTLLEQPTAVPSPTLGRAQEQRPRQLKWLGVAALTVACVLTVPAAGHPIGAGGEYEYQAAMIVALRDHLQWGTQIAWSYGPFGYLNEPVYMDFYSWLLALVANLVGHIVLFVVVAMFLLRVKAQQWIFVSVSVVIVFSVDRYIGHEFERFAVLDQKVAIAAALLLYLAGETSSRKETIIFAGVAGLLIGYLFVDKGTYLMTGIGLAIVYGILSLKGRRIASSIAMLAGVIAGYSALWLLAGQSPLNIVSYFHAAFEVIAGYTPAMSWTEESGVFNVMAQQAITVGMLAVVAAMLVVTALQRNWAVVRLLMLSAPIVFFQYKNSFVRVDEGHALEFWALLATILGLVLARIVASRRAIFVSAPLGATIVAACLVLVAGLGPYIGGFPNRIHSEALMTPSLSFPDNLTSYRHAASLIAHPNRRTEEQSQVQASLLALYPLPQNIVDELRQGTVDVTPYDLQLAFAYDFNWDPQPVLLSYSAYRPYLDHLVALHYIGSDGPEFVLFRPYTIDLRYPLFDEPEAYRMLFERYKLIGRTGDYLVLQRRTDTYIPPDSAAGSVVGRLGDWITVPPHGDQRLYGRLHVGYSSLGQVMSVVDRPPELTIRFKYAGGNVSPAYRYVAGSGPDGVDLSAYAPEADQVQRLAEGIFDQPIESIQIVASEPSAAYQQVVTIDYFTKPVVVDG